jgi:hypothetical protein
MKKRTNDIDEIFRNKFSEFESEPFPDSKVKIFTDFYSEEAKRKSLKNPFFIGLKNLYVGHKLKVAASLIGLIFLSVIVFLILPHFKNREISENAFPKEKISSPNPTVSSDIQKNESLNLRKGEDKYEANIPVERITSTSGRQRLIKFKSDKEKLVLYLPDSSRVYLNKSSDMSYSVDFMKEERIVNISGEAYFDVKKMNNKVFIVNTAFGRIEVLGTSFCVKSLPKGREEVLVESGKVLFFEKINPEKNQVLLTPGMKAYLEPGKPIITTPVEDVNELAWKTNKLIFKKTLMKEVIREIEIHYGIKIDASDFNVYDCHFTGRFELSTSLNEVLATLALSLNGSYEIKNKECILKSKGCN